MSFSFTVDAPTKANLTKQIHENLALIVKADPGHKRACDYADNAAGAIIPGLSDVPDRMFRASVSVAGSMSHEDLEGSSLCTGAYVNMNIGVMSYHLPKPTTQLS